MDELNTQEEVGEQIPHEDSTEARDTVSPVLKTSARKSGGTWVGKSGWGRKEIAVVGVLAVLLIVIAGYFVFFVSPEKSGALSRRKELQSLERQVLEARDRYGKITSTEEQVARLIGSADRFESEYLPNELVGKTALYQRINNLISSNGLINTAGPSYRELRANDGSRQVAEEEDGGARARLGSIFPGVLVSVTVDGTYQQIRSFLRQLETSEQFIVISSVALEPSDRTQTASQPVEAPVVPKAKSRGEIVSLKVEFAAYFRRDGNVDSPTAIEGEN